MTASTPWRYASLTMIALPENAIAPAEASASPGQTLRFDASWAAVAAALAARLASAAMVGDDIARDSTERVARLLLHCPANWIHPEDISATMDNAELESLRRQIDTIDADIVELLASRFRITAKVGELKARHQLAAVDSARESRQQSRYRELAELHGLNPEMVVSVFRQVIDQVVANHRAA